MYGQPMYGQPPMMQPGFGQPMMAPPMQPVQPIYGMQPPVQPGPTVVIVDHGNNGGLYCQSCNSNTGQFTRRKIGCVAILWGLCLLWFTGFLCCLPCCMDSCKDTEIVCSKCNLIKQVQPANCC